MNTTFEPIHIDLIPCAEELHVVPSTGTGGRGIASDPLMIPKGDLDNPGFINLISVKPSLKIVFGAGRFFTSGFGLPSNTCVIIGQGVNKTTIQLKDNIDSKLKNRFWPHIRMIGDGGAWCLNYGMRDITLDCNWRGQPWVVTNGNSKIEPLVVNSVRGKAERVDILDFGSHGSKEIYKDGLEAFPLALQTVSMGPPYDKYLPEHKHRGEENASFLEISQCRVLSATFLGGGYCTGVFVRTNQPGAGDRLPKGARTTLAAWVHDNYVADIKGIAFGCAHSEHVLFERNHAKSKVGFNCDTGRCENITLRENCFLGNSHGVNFSPDGGGKDFIFVKNHILFGPRSANPITGAPEGYIGLSIGNTIDAVSDGNRFIGPADWEATRFSNYPVHVIDDTRLIIGSESVPAPTPPPDDALEAALQANINLIAERNAALELNRSLFAANVGMSDAAKESAQKLLEAEQQAERAKEGEAIKTAKLTAITNDVNDFLLAQDRLKTYVEIEDP